MWYIKIDNSVIGCARQLALEGRYVFWKTLGRIILAGCLRSQIGAQEELFWGTRPARAAIESFLDLTRVQHDVAMVLCVITGQQSNLAGRSYGPLSLQDDALVWREG
jgi:hypothetical protein